MISSSGLVCPHLSFSIQGRNSLEFTAQSFNIDLRQPAVCNFEVSKSNKRAAVGWQMPPARFVF
jgi:hypothetical protein